jgi:PAS domain S-box-containing protein
VPPARPGDPGKTPSPGTRDGLFWGIVGTASLFGAGYLAVYLAWSAGPILIELPWFNALAYVCLLLAAAIVAFLAWGRYQVLWGPVPYWIGLGFAGYSVLVIFYILTWPGLLPARLLAPRAQSSGWLNMLAWTLLAGCLLAAVRSRSSQSEEQARREGRGPGVLASWLGVVTLIGLLLVVGDRWLPALVTPTGGWTTPTWVWQLCLALAYAVGAVWSTRRYRHSGDTLLGYVALSQLALAFGIGGMDIGGRRYDLWWYLARVLGVGGFLAMMVGLLTEYVTLFRREQAKTREVEAQAAALRRVEAALRQLNEQLEYRVQDRTAALQEREAWLRVTLASIGDAVMATDTAGRITFLNPVAEGLTGWRQAEAAGQPADAVFRIRDQRTGGPAEDLVGRVLAEGAPVRLANHTALLARDGRVIPIEDSAGPIRGTQGQIVGVVVVFHDVTEKRQAQEALQSLARFPDENPHPILRIACDGTLLYANPASARLLRGWRCQVGQRLPADWCAKVADASARGVVTEAEVTCAEGRIYSCILTPIAAAGYLNLYARDITARKQAEEALRRAHDELEAVFAGIGDAVVVYDVNGVPLKANQPAVATLGFDPVGVGRAVRLRRIALHYVDGQSVSAEDMPTRRAERGETFSDQPYRLTGADGQTRIIHCAGAPLHRDGQLWGTVLSWHDVTDRETLVQQLQDQQMVLEQRVQERTADLAQKASQLQALTTELTLAEQRERQRLAEQLHDGLQQILVAAKFRVTLLPRMESSEIATWSKETEHLLAEAIAASRTLTGELSPPILQTGGLVAGLEWLVRYKAERYHLAVALDADAEAVPDSEAMTLLLFQSVRELLFNIVKHAQVQEARLEVRRRDGHLHIVVSDQGVGFDPATAHSTSLGGLGLSSIRQRLEYLGGCVGIVSAPGQGCRITLAAPLRNQASAPPTPVTLTPADGRSAPSAVRGQKTRILLVDDHAVVRQALAQMLGSEPDLEVVGEAADGKAAVERTKELAPDVVLMDISMPGVNGIEATRQIRAECPNIQVIGLSMFGATEQTEAMRKAGAVGYVSKSAPAEELLAAIRACAARGAGSH